MEARWPIRVWLTDRTEEEVPVGSKILVDPAVRAAILGEDTTE
jgi:4-hydroxy-3-methylbut-2-en-1-yl diphosphate synthase IspG/GcpE